ncbi:hypothetical protein CsSME_00034952 [Camellia sinensis var. sinensis]
MKGLSENDIEREPKSTLYEGHYGERHRVLIKHNGVLLPCQPKMDIGKDGELSPKVLKLFWGVHPSPKHTHDVG